MKRYLNLKDRLMREAIVQCDICGYIDPFEFVENAPRWDKINDKNRGDGWSYGANPNAHFCPYCTEILNKKLGWGAFHRMVGEDVTS